LEPLYVPRETGNNAYEKFGGTNKEYYGIFRNGLLVLAHLQKGNYYNNYYNKIITTFYNKYFAIFKRSVDA